MNQNSLLMLKRILIFSCVAVTFLAACQKDLKTETTAINNREIADDDFAFSGAATGVADSTSEWLGTYSGYFKPYPIVPDDDLIYNGVAQLPYLDRQFSFSDISYIIPEKYPIYGDSISFEAKLKNPKSSGFGDYDVVVRLIGDEHSVEVHFVADDDYVQYTEYTVGNRSNTKLAELVHLFGTFQTMKLAQKNYYSAVYINNNLVYKFKYGSKNAIGRLKSISIAFKGYGSCTKVGLKNSHTSSPLMLEEFNVQGKSNTLFY